MKRTRLEKHLPELVEVESLAQIASQSGKVQTEGTVSYRGISFPLYSFSFGSEDKSLPTFILTGGVHGLERIGTRILIAYLRSICQLLTWDEVLMSALEKSRLLFYPIVNPGGMYWQLRSNPDGVDLMRNAPVEADKTSPIALYSGHHISPKLPWFRGNKEKLAPEAQILCDFVRRECWNAKVALTLDLHSGFGSVDRFWFPYAKTKNLFPSVAEVFALKCLIDNTYPNHVYCIEPQSRQYTAHGDLWDYLYDEHREKNSEKLFIPFSLEIGSWAWVKKNPRQLFHPLGPFNPILPHRRQRTLRRHLILFDFLQRASIAHSKWAFPDAATRAQLDLSAKKFWLPKSM